MINSSVLEETSHEIHEIWTNWMTYLFTESIKNEDGTYTIPKDKVKRWMNQMRTPYSQLSEKEKNSDREQAIKILEALQIMY